MLTIQEHDQPAGEGMARVGISLEGLIDAFPSFSEDEITAIYCEVHKDEIHNSDLNMKINCS